VLGVGDGLADVLELVLGSGLGLGEDVGGGDDELSVGEGDAVSVGEGDAVSVGDGVEVSAGVDVSVGDELEVSLGDAVGVSAGDRAAELVLGTMAAVSTAVFGGERHVVLGGATVAVPACAASDAPNAVKPRMLNPATVPSAARLRISALTRATSLLSGSQAVGTCRTSRLLTLFVPVLTAPASGR
jgi:hypothetical protein